MAYDFNAANSNLSCSPPMTGEPITMAAWVYPQTTGSIRSICALGVSSGSSRRQLALGTASAVGLVDAGTVNATLSSTYTAPQNEWTHACGVFESATSRSVYANGGNNASNTTNRGTLTTPNTFNIAARYLSGAIGGYMVGRIAEVGIWNVALTAAEIASLAGGMTCDKVRPQSLVFYAPLVRDLVDYKGKLTITNNNGATVANHPRVYA
jgi:hypothetical protein